MKIVLLTETFSARMGYIQTALPKLLAREGHEVHVLTMPLLPGYQYNNFGNMYGGFTTEDAPIVHDVRRVNGYTVHVLPAGRRLGYLRMLGLEKKLRELKPDIVQSLAAIGWLPMDAARLRNRFKYKLFTGNHNAMSTSRVSLGLDGNWGRRVKSLCIRFLPGRLVSLATERCYAVTRDCAEIAWKYYGVEKRKVKTMHLGVDTDFFFPVNSAEAEERRRALRAELGFQNDQIVCVYSGKMSDEKNPLIVAQAIQRLNAAGRRFGGIFIGNGSQRDAVAAMPDCRVVPFMPYWELGAYYRAADIGVWPTNESTSSLDAAACGLPLIISDGVVYRDHVEGNGLVAKIGDLDDMVAKLSDLEDAQTRSNLGRRGAEKMRSDFSWESVARRRIADYQEALAK